MTPYYSDDLVTIYHGRWQDVGPSTAPLILTDPPYGTGGWRRSTTGAGSNPAAALIHEDWDNGDADWVLMGSPPIITFWPPASTLRLLERAQHAGLTKHRALYWQKPDPKPQVGGRTRWSIEPIWVLSTDGFLLYGDTDLFRQSAIRENRDEEAVGHPYQKPVSVMRWLISKTRVDVVLDPFMGSGSTLVAAKSLGRHAVGIEIEERYCEIAARRCSQEVLGLVG